MVLSYKRTVRTTGNVEDVFHALEKILTFENFFPRTRWRWREAFSSRQYDSDSQFGITYGARSVVISHRRFIKVCGELKSGEKISAIVELVGITHESEEDDYSDPTSPTRLNLTVTVPGYTVLRKRYTCDFSDEMWHAMNS